MTGVEIEIAKDVVANNDMAAKDEPKRFDVANMVKSPPQDLQAPLFNTNEVSISTVDGSPTSSKSDVWVSPNKSGEADGFENETTQSDHTTPRDNKSPRSDDGFNSAELMITGSRLETLALNDEDVTFEKAMIPPLDLSVISDPELQINASGKYWIKISHGGMEKMIMLPAAAGGHLEMGTFEIAETLAATFDITDDFEIVGLTAVAILSEDETMKFKHHGEVVIPLSFVASGQLKAIIEAGNETIPSFELVTKKLCHFNTYDANGHGLEAEFDTVSSDEMSFGEEREYTDAFIDLMENSDEFTAVEKNVLLRFGIDEAHRGNALFRAAFRVAAFTSDATRFMFGLKAIANVLLGTDDTANDKSDIKSPPSKTIFGMFEFISAADKLLIDGDFTAEQYVTVVDAIYSGTEDAEKLFELHCCPDFLLACENEELRGALLIKDLMVLGNSLPLINAGPSDDMLKWAIHTGIHNFGANLSIALPVEFQNIIYHMFSSGDEIVLSACKDFVETNDSAVIDGMILREWEIYQRNHERFFVNDNALAAERSTASDASDVSPVLGEYEEVPDLLLTAVAALVDLGELKEDTAAAMIASAMKGNILVKGAFETYMEDGDTEEFLKQLKFIACDDQFASCRAFASPSGRVPPGCEAAADDDNAAAANVIKDSFREALEIIKLDDRFGTLEISALKLAAVRGDKFMANALSYFLESQDFETFTRDLLYVANRIIYETELAMES